MSELKMKQPKGVRLDHISKIYQDPKTKKDFRLVLQNKDTFSSSFSINAYFAGKCKFSRGFKMSLIRETVC